MGYDLKNISLISLIWLRFIYALNNCVATNNGRLQRDFLQCQFNVKRTIAFRLITNENFTPVQIVRTKTRHQFGKTIGRVEIPE